MCGASKQTSDPVLNDLNRFEITVKKKKRKKEAKKKKKEKKKKKKKKKKKEKEKKRKRKRRRRKCYQEPHADPEKANLIQSCTKKLCIKASHFLSVETYE